MLARVRSPNVVRLISCFIASQPKGGVAGVLVRALPQLENGHPPRRGPLLARPGGPRCWRVAPRPVRPARQRHRSADVKPENVVVSPDFARVSLIDLTFARDAQGLGATLATGTLGAFSLGFCAPEDFPTP
jgi:hypothetical protein